MKESYLERKKRRTRVTGTIITFLLIFGFLNGFMVFMLRFYESSLGITLFIALNAFIIWLFCFFMGFKTPSRKLPEWLNKEIEDLEKKYREIFERVSREQRLSVNHSNENCPNCRKKNIVNKIKRVSGEVGGSFSLGFGSVNGEIDTNPVNHCNDCGYEWKKDEIDYSGQRDMSMNEMLRPIYNFFNKSEDNNSDYLKKFSAKALKIFIKKHGDGFYAEQLVNLSERDLRKYGCK